MSESDDAAANVELTPRGGRSLARGGAYERTQSVDRARKRSEPSPVFYLEPLDWLRSEGSSPLPLKEKAIVLQKVPSEANPKVRNHGESPY